MKILGNSIQIIYLEKFNQKVRKLTSQILIRYYYSSIFVSRKQSLKFYL